MAKAEKCMCESCKNQRGEGFFQVMRRRQARWEAIKFIIYLVLGFIGGYAVAELIKVF